MYFAVDPSEKINNNQQKNLWTLSTPRHFVYKITKLYENLWWRRRWSHVICAYSNKIQFGRMMQLLFAGVHTVIDELRLMNNEINSQTMP
uniref:Uncharacterized protein n=1 Tax=Romanomermis culicivorax TaxID=13658 RepID=A0A915JBQ6_ROMCU